MTPQLLAAHGRLDAAQLALDEARALLRQAEENVEEPLISTEELATRLGLSAWTVSQSAREGKIPSFKIGGALRFRYSDVLEAAKR